MIQLLSRVDRFTGDIDSELSKHILIYAREHRGRMCIGILKVIQLLHRELCDRVGRSRHGQSDQSLIHMKSRIVIAHMIDLKILDRLDYIR